MLQLPKYISKRAISSKQSNDFSDSFNGYQPLLACWTLEFTLALGLYKLSGKDGKRSIVDCADFAHVTGIEIESTYLSEGGKEDFVVNGTQMQYSDSLCKQILQNKLAEFQNSFVHDELGIF